MLTVLDIINQAREQTEENASTYPDPLVLSYYNAAMADLTPVAKMLASQENISLAIQANNAVASLPIAAHEIVAVYLLPTGGTETFLRQISSHDPVSRGWVQLANQLRVRNSSLIPSGSTIRVDFYRRLVLADVPSDTPDLPVQYRNLPVLYCCAKIQERASILPLKSDFLAEYFLAKQQFALQRIWDMEPHNREAIVQLRSGGLLGGGRR